MLCVFVLCIFIQQRCEASKTLSQLSTATTKAVPVEHCNGVVWCCHTCLVIAILHSQHYHLGLLPTQDAVHACCEAIRPTTITIGHTWSSLFQDAVTCVCRFHGTLSSDKNAGYILVNLPHFWFFGHRPYTRKANKFRSPLQYSHRTNTETTNT